MIEWTKGEFRVVWSATRQAYDVFKSGKRIRRVYHWRNAAPYLS